MRFDEVVRARLDAPMAAAGFPLNSADETSVLYEALVPDFLDRYPGLDPVWDDHWHREAPCVDLWLYLRPGNLLEVHLEHWDLVELANKYGDDALEARTLAALSGGESMSDRIEIVAEVLELALVKARVS